MNPNTMTLDECRDWLAREDGWTPMIVEPWDCPGWGRGNERMVDHPYHPTLDGAAGAMPEGWMWSRLFGFKMWYAARPTSDGQIYGGWEIEVPDTGNEILDRYRLAVACRMAQKDVK